MEQARKFYESFKKGKKFPAGKITGEAKKKNLLENKNQLLPSGDSTTYVSGAAGGTRPRRRTCCGR
ncbi:MULTISPECIES: hypothetical protein [Bacillaceae]|uniref:Uncharacterized protein n=1 Tax=Bacillus infantis TaxID=324767 RepID=A0A5D4SPW1_9BACI|nr:MULTISPECIES: hypothetical protein [Bacillus]OXT15888.1 hypothetical protein B9K06_18130 [Bacillus sp. OG2]MCA1036826.1 hypothetical protein [Bacillus infantis]MCK6206924.1 hypothetical protein [Bacillus infantis]MDW2878461.1 hypothetical protein [Bacillus infantis]TYS47999.1 hypothetical protein FZD51_13855 [Bacillus infantis]